MIWAGFVIGAVTFVVATFNSASPKPGRDIAGIIGGALLMAVCIAIKAEVI